MLKRIEFEDLVRLLSSSRQSDRFYLTWLICGTFCCEALYNTSFETISKVSLGLSTSLSVGIQAVQCDLFSYAVLVPHFSMLILPLPLLALRSKSTSVSAGIHM